jgi:DNA repair protein RadC
MSKHELARQPGPGEGTVDLDSAIRPRERLLLHGAHTLTDAELVSVLLSGGQAGASAVVVADRVLRAVGGGPGLARCHPEALCQLPGLGQVSAARLVAALALPLRRDTMGTITVTDAAQLVAVFRPVLAGARHERLAVAVCDRGLRVKLVRMIAEGSADSCPAPMRDLMATVLRHDGHAFAIAHNHPSGDPTPSAADRSTTMRCRTAAQTAGVEFLSHLVLGEHDTWDRA